ncbi:MAG: NUDIX domain-containing protein [Solirubrobacteraceae bacterium]
MLEDQQTRWRVHGERQIYGSRWVEVSLVDVELPAGLVDPGEDAAATAAGEVEEETGWRPREMVQAIGVQAMVGTVDSPHAVFISRGADHVGGYIDRADPAKIEWLPLRRPGGTLGEASPLAST